MAVIWQKKLNGHHYEVRTAGRSRRLYKNGVCHSQYNPAAILSGSIWDLLILPAFYEQHSAFRRVLVLGVGGGAVIRQLNALAPPANIIGIEKDPVHLDIARRFFELDEENVELIEADAVAWLGTCRQMKFDLIIEDIFAESGGRPVRAISADVDWYQALFNRLSTRGRLVMNFANVREFRASALYREPALRNHFASIYQLTTPTLDNHVVAMHKLPVTQGDLHKNIMEHPELARAVYSRKLKYRARKLARAPGAAK